MYQFSSKGIKCICFSYRQFLYRSASILDCVVGIVIIGMTGCGRRGYPRFYVAVESAVPLSDIFKNVINSNILLFWIIFIINTLLSYYTGTWSNDDIILSSTQAIVDNFATYETNLNLSTYIKFFSIQLQNIGNHYLSKLL